MNYYVYVHKIPKTDIVFYVGSNYRTGNFRRAYQFNSRPEKWLKEIAKHGNVFDVEIIAFFDKSKDALKHELELMEHYQKTHNWCWCNGEKRSDEAIMLLRKATSCNKIVAIKNDEQYVFDSIRFASHELTIPRSTIQNYIKTGKIHSSGYYFKNY